MKRRAPWAAVVAIAVILFAGAVSATAADVSFGFFYSNLSPYGTWAVSADYGQVWRPYAYGPGWNPYYDGHWVYTDLGWAWVSDYPWGAIPYHYGTWAVDPVLGWTWVPGYVWAPSWVVFASGGDYIGWAPVPPRYVVGASVAFGDIGPDRFVVVPAGAFLAPRLRGHVVPRAAARNVIGRTQIVNNITVQNNVVVNRGPDPRGIEKVARVRVRPVPIHSVERLTPSGRFDVDEVRVDRARPRATSPERARPSQLARPSEATKPSPSARPSAPPSAQPSGLPTAPQAGRGPTQERAQPAPTQASKPPAPRKPPASQKPAKPPKPPDKKGGR